MRVTQFTFYNNFILNQQKDLSELTKVQTQLATGKKIEYMYDNPVIFNKDLKFQEEINSFDQIKSSASFAKTFANETDTVLNEISSTLDSFKTKLLQAANDSNNSTNREAIANELEGELNHLKDLANTSLDGKYIFSGSAFDKPPIRDDFTYQGNDKKVKAFLGKNVEREYNIDGKSLFLGRDNDYKKHLTFNVPQFDKMKANPEFVVRGNDGKLYIDKHIKDHGKIPDSENPPENVVVDDNSEIRMLTGVEDVYDATTDSYSDGTSYFYIKGRKPNGDLIDTKFSLSNSASVSELLEKIGEIYGNNESSKVVDVSLNDMGQVQIKDLNSGKMISDFFMVASDKDEVSIDDLVKNGDYVVEFQKSDFNGIRDNDTIKANNSYFDNRIFKFNSKFKLLDGSRDAVLADKIVDILGSEGVRSSDNSIQTLNDIHLTGTDTSGNSVDTTLSITSTTTMQDLVDAIKNNYGDVDVKLENGELVVVDNTISKTDSSKLSISLTGEDSNGNALEVFASKDSVDFNRLYMKKDNYLLSSNVSQITKDTIIYYKDGQKIVEKNPLQEYANNDTVIVDTLGVDIPSDGYQEINVKFYDKNNVLQQGKIVLRDSEDANGHKSYFWIDKDRDGTEDSDEVFDIYNTFGEKTSAHTTITTKTELDPKTCKLCQTEEKRLGVTFSQLSDVVSMMVTGNIPASNTYDDYQKAVLASKSEVESGMDDKGRFYLKDLTSSPTNIKLSLYSDNNAISFQENNAITIDEPQTDFFDTLQKAIDAVRNGFNYANSDSDDPRNFGIQGAIEAIGHVMDRVRREHAKIGALSQEFDLSISRVEMLKTHVTVLQSDNIDTDIGEASMQLNSLQTSYQALLASIAKVNNLTLLNYLK